MDLPAVITQLKRNVPMLGGRVAGAADFSASMAGELRPEAFPACYVVPLGLEAQFNDTTNALYQPITERVGVVVEFDNTDDRRGQSVTLIYHPMQVELFAALLNWRGTDRPHSLRGFEIASADMLQSDRARIFYQWVFTLEGVLTELDGWHEPTEPLVRIEANGSPGDPPPAFAVDLPQP